MINPIFVLHLLVPRDIPDTKVVTVASSNTNKQVQDLYRAGPRDTVLLLFFEISAQKNSLAVTYRTGFVPTKTSVTYRAGFVTAKIAETLRRSKAPPHLGSTTAVVRLRHFRFFEDDVS